MKYMWDSKKFRKCKNGMDLLYHHVEHGKAQLQTPIAAGKFDVLCFLFTCIFDRRTFELF